MNAPQSNPDKVIALTNTYLFESLSRLTQEPVCAIKSEHSSLLYKFNFVALDTLWQMISDEINYPDHLVPSNHYLDRNGRQCEQHRIVVFFTEDSSKVPYHWYLNIKVPSIQMGPFMSGLLNMVNTALDSHFNSIMCVYLRNGRDYFSRHSEKNADPQAGIAIVNFGVTRTFRVRNRQTNKVVIDLPLVTGSLIRMIGDFQHEFMHEIPIEKRVTEDKYLFIFKKHY